MLNFDRRPTSADFLYYSPVTEKNVTGIGVLFGAAMSRIAFALRLFHCLCASSFGHRGGRSPRARRCSIGTPTPVLVALPIGVGVAVTYRNWSNQMKFTIQLEDLDRAQLRLSCAQANLTVLAICLSNEGGDTPTGPTINSAFHAVVELIESANDLLSKAEACHV